MMAARIHASSVIEDGAEFGDDVVIGPFCHVGAGVRLASGVQLHSHVVVHGRTSVGEGSRIFPFASIGHEPQDLKYSGEETELVIGRNCIIREGVTMNPGTAGDKGRTVVGDECVFLANAHVAHDCIIGDRVVFSNNVMLAGHCQVGDNVIIGGGAGIHQFCRVGQNAFIGGLAGVENDVIPFGIALGNRAGLGGLNVIGMKRAGIARESIHHARRLYKQLFSSNSTVAEAIEQINGEIAADPVCRSIIDFVRDSGDRALCTPRA